MSFPLSLPSLFREFPLRENSCLLELFRSQRIMNSQRGTLLQKQHRLIRTSPHCKAHFSHEATVASCCPQHSKTIDHALPKHNPYGRKVGGCHFRRSARLPITTARVARAHLTCGIGNGAVLGGVPGAASCTMPGPRGIQTWRVREELLRDGAYVGAGRR